MTGQLIPILILLAASSWLLGKGADWLTDGASGLAYRLGITPLAIGLTIVAFGTSLPELAASLIGGEVIAMGNVLGSNMLNLGLVLAITAMLGTIPCDGRFVRFEVVLMVLIGPIVWLMAIVGRDVIRAEGLILFLGLVAFTVITMIRGRKHELPIAAAELNEPPEKARWDYWRLITLTVIGLVGVTVGAKGLVDGAVSGARLFGVSERVIALTIVAGGTSLPELATCVAAVLKGHGELAIGNLIGSNIFNLLGVLGLVALIRPIAEVGAGSLWIDFPAVILLQAICIPLMLWRNRVGKIEGLVLLGCYAVYMLVVFGRRTL